MLLPDKTGQNQCQDQAAALSSAGILQRLLIPCIPVPTSTLQAVPTVPITACHLNLVRPSCQQPTAVSFVVSASVLRAVQGLTSVDASLGVGAFSNSAQELLDILTQDDLRPCEKQ
jgi:hypothetical protein